jgi:aspartate/methionine/tyrosine aminotransferase
MTFGPVLPLAATLSERAIGVSSLSKSYGLPGIRTGWLTTRDAALMETFLAAKEQMMIAGSVVDEAIAAAAYERRAELLPTIRDDIETALAITRRWMADQPGVVGFPRVRASVPLDPARFYRLLFERYGTIVGPGHWFEQPDASFRLGYGWPDRASLEAGLAALSSAAADVLA